MRSKDTSLAAEAAQYEGWARMSFAERVGQTRRFSSSMMSLARAAIREQHPRANPQQLLVLYVAAHYGEDLAAAVERCLPPGTP